jgi:hypothetical protein
LVIVSAALFSGLSLLGLALLVLARLLVGLRRLLAPSSSLSGATGETVVDSSVMA